MGRFRASTAHLGGGGSGDSVMGGLAELALLRVVSCCVVLCCVVLCCAVLCCVVLCCVVLCCVVLCCVVLCCVVSCRVVLCCVVSCRVVSCRVVLCCVVLCCVVLCAHHVPKPLPPGHKGPCSSPFHMSPVPRNTKCGGPGAEIRRTHVRSGDLPRPPPTARECTGREGTSEAAPEAVRQAVGRGCQSGTGCPGRGDRWDGRVSNTCQARGQTDPMRRWPVSRAAPRWTRSDSNHHRPSPRPAQ